METRSSSGSTETGVPERRALVVDDDAGVRVLVRRILMRNGFDAVDTARDGGEAIEKIEENDYGVVVLDLMMPRFDGSAVVRWLQERRPDLLRKVIAMSAFGKSAFKAVCPPIGRLLEKPFDVNHLVKEATEAYWLG